MPVYENLWEIRKDVDDAGRIEGVVYISLSDVIERDLEQFLDLLGETLVGSPLLSDIDYTIIGVESDEMLKIVVSGGVTLLLEDEE